MKYIDQLEKATNKIYQIAQEARKQGIDPSNQVEIKLAKNLAERVIGLISTVAPQLENTNIIQRILELEKKYQKLDWRIACQIALEIAQEKFCKFDSKTEAIEVGIRTGFAYVTVGVVSSPIEGFTKLELKKTKNNKKYFCMYFQGPIRSAGGTAASVSVVIADYVRKHLNYEEYDPTDKEIQRTHEEIEAYHNTITNLQYKPTKEEIYLITKSLPIQIDGDATTTKQVKSNRSLERVKTNNIRGGMVLLMSECIPAKAAKLQKQLSTWESEFQLNWNFLDQVIHLQKSIKAEKKTEKKITENRSYLQDTVGGRPILAYPMRPGGFRLRYGRSRTNGYSAQSIHPATMEVLDHFIATGTQLRVERPGKATAITVCDSIEGPIVKLKDQSVVQLTTQQEAKQFKKEIKEILYLGDILINYGDFYDRAQPLAPAGYCQEWWQQEKEYLHPNQTHFWKLITGQQAQILHQEIKKAKHEEQKIILPFNKQIKQILENLGVPHQLIHGEHIVITEQDILTKLFKDTQLQEAEDGLEYVNKLNIIPIRDKVGTFIGARMGRPEKAKPRKMKGSPNGLFPLTIEQREEVKKAMTELDMQLIPESLKGVSALANKKTEDMRKGILRAKYNLTVNKDGTLRYDASELPITHVKPKEIGTSVQQLKKLGYTHDIYNKALTKEDQILTLQPQDILLPSCMTSPDLPSGEFFFAATQCIDEMLTKIYKQPAFYKCKTPQDLVGHLVIGLAPHTSAGIVGRIVGFTQTQAMYAHPFFHAAMRRDADGDESCFLLALDALINFSRAFLPQHRGSTQDAPLTLTWQLIASEIDDMAFNIDSTTMYPKEFYQATLQEKMPWEVSIPIVKNNIENSNISFTHDTTNINDGVRVSAYKTIPSMQEKLEAQMELADKIRAVDAADVARIVIETHFLKDAKGNLDKYFKQQFRTKSEHFRRPPLAQKEKLIQTVSYGSIIKYLDPSLKLANKYPLPLYLKQILEKFKADIESIFGTSEKQTTL